MSNENWIAHAYPLQQVTIKLQGTRHSDKTAIVAQLETVLARLKAATRPGKIMTTISAMPSSTSRPCPALRSSMPRPAPSNRRTPMPCPVRPGFFSR